MISSPQAKSADFRELESYLQERRRWVDAALDRYLPSESQTPPQIHKSMRYSVFAGGKRLRPILVIAAAEACGGRASQVMPTACAAEMIHTYSLVHDDLPAMDNDDLRRGRPTNHKMYGEGMAILAGDGLLTRAFEVMALNAGIKSVSPGNVVRAILAMARGAGTQGMVGGQVVDVQMDKGRWRRLANGSRSRSLKMVRYIHEHKTAALITACLEAGALLARGSPRQVSALTRYGRCIGLAFQIKDDVLDLVGDKKKLGKSGSDADNEKMTYPAVDGIERSLETAERLIGEARASLFHLRGRGRILNALADYVLRREH